MVPERTENRSKTTNGPHRGDGGSSRTGGFLDPRPAFRERNVTTLAERKCRQCEGPLPKRKRGRPLQFCSAECRSAWWREHRRRGPVELRCQDCGRAWTTMQNRGTKRCPPCREQWRRFDRLRERHQREREERQAAARGATKDRLERLREDVRRRERLHQRRRRAA
jgi:DNA-directed RNA polymerase subunit RPC12/RpoP